MKLFFPIRLLLFIFGFTAPLFAQIPQENCIDFESLKTNVNYCDIYDPGEVFHQESGVLVSLEELFGRYGYAVADTTEACRPDVFNGQHLLLNQGIQFDFSQLEQQPYFVVFDVGICDGIQFIRTNSGPLFQFPSNSSFQQTTSLGVTVIYNEGNFIIEGPVYELFYGGFETGIDLICYEFGSDSCDLRDLVIEPYECTDSSYFADITFNHSGNPEDSFCIIRPDTSFGPFAYDSLPVTLGPLQKQCDSITEFIIRDKIDTTCVIIGSAGFPCCEKCRLFDLEVDVIECVSEELLEIKVNFEHQNNLSNFFNLYGDNNELIGRYEYGNLPITITNFPVRNGDFQFLRVCDTEEPDCCAEIEFPTPDCPELCSIRELRFEKTDCENDSFKLFIDFEVIRAQSDSFYVAGNGRLEGPFAYMDLPIILGPYPGDCITEYEFVIWDSEYELCSVALEIGKVCCGENCEIGELLTEITDCENDSFFIDLDFKFSGIVSDSFRVVGNGRNEGPFAYSDLPIRLGPYAGDCETFYEIGVIDNENEDCRSGKEIGKICCGEKDCVIRELSFEKSRCENDSFYLFIDFVVENPKSDGFIVLGNGRREGPFRYRSLPLRLGPYAADCKTEYEFVIQDREDPECKAIIELGKVCCEERCAITELEAEVLGCNSDSTYTVRINFNYQGTNNSGFDIYTRDGFWGYIRSNPPFNLIEFPKSGSRYDLIKVCANDKPDCCKAIEIETPNCEGTNTVSTTQPQGDIIAYWDGQELVIKSTGNDIMKYDVRLYDISGQTIALVRDLQIPVEGYRWYSGELPAGMYILLVMDGEKINSRKLFKGN